ncbi:MsnO8 family LLM class oxidoreductase [Streptomyces sp. NPDC047009]|uniref:MsnO8 family LLM class oxidoreductase n=1 Tax=Streptomyces sp. NPDC047009 TaxID=3154496 RepID=UPI0033F2E4ED
MTLRLSVLDQSPIPDGAAPANALAATLELARAADDLGYHRMWVAEHHQTAAFAGTAPEVLVAELLNTTQRLRIGSGGVLLPRYEPLKVAETFRILATLHPDRVDLGIGRAGGHVHDFPHKLAELADLLEAPAPGYRPPQLWLLGAGPASAYTAVTLGLSYAYAHFLRPEHSVPALEIHNVRTIEAMAHSALAVRAIVAPTKAAARDLAESYLLWRSRRDLGHDEPLPSPFIARTHRWTTQEKDRADRNRRALIAGTPPEVHDQLAELAKIHGVDEIIVNTLTHDPADRLLTYQLLAEAFHLVPTA